MHKYSLVASRVGQYYCCFAISILQTFHISIISHDMQYITHRYCVLQVACKCKIAFHTHDMLYEMCDVFTMGQWKVVS